MPTSLDKILNSQFVLIGLAGLAFLIALWLVVVIVRMMTGGRLRFNSGRTRQARLGIVDAFDLDRQRQLIIIRRDNTEHLIMIGGPNDLVIESEIVRVEARDNRRATDKPDAFGDRIPAPTMAPDEAQSVADEPPLPLPAPMPAPVAERPRRPFGGSAQEPALEPLPLRTPTFPLPRRPEPERRPPPPPESASRVDEPAPTPPSVAAPEPAAPPFPAPYVPAPAVPAPAPAEASAPPPADTFPVPTPVPPQVLPPIVPTQGMELPPRPLRPPPPSFLKPLPPRPPIRPLRRANPLAPGAPAGPVVPPRPEAAPPAGAVAPEATPPAANLPSPPAEPPAPHAAPPVERAAPPVEPVAQPPATKTEDSQALESLEEEMAKLLGRG